VQGTTGPSSTHALTGAEVFDGCRTGLTARPIESVVRPGRGGSTEGLRTIELFSSGYATEKMKDRRGVP